MVQLRTVWGEEWGPPPHLRTKRHLSESAHQVLSSSQPPYRMPLKSLQQRVFPTVFKDSLSGERRTILRSYPVNSELPIDSEQEEALRAAIREVLPRFEQLAALFPRLGALTGEDLRTKDRKVELLGRLLPHVIDGHPWSQAEVDAFIDHIRGAGDAPWSEGLHQLLGTDPDLVARLEAMLSAREMPSVVPGPDEHSTALLRGFLDNPEARRLSAKPLRLGKVTTDELGAAWAAVLTADVDGLHTEAHRLGLTSEQVAPRPRLLRDPERDVDRPLSPTRWLDVSVEWRLRKALGDDKLANALLPTMPELLEAEVVRATSPLGLSSQLARIVFALGVQVMSEYVDKMELNKLRTSGVLGDAEPRTLATLKLMDNIARYRKKHGMVEGVSTLPLLALYDMSEPRVHYLATLWRKVHTYDVHDRTDITPGHVWSLLTSHGVRVMQRISKMPRPAETGYLLDDDGSPVDPVDYRDADTESLHQTTVSAEIINLTTQGVSSDELREAVRRAREGTLDDEAWDDLIGGRQTEMSRGEFQDYVDRYGPIVPGSVSAPLAGSDRPDRHERHE